ncbi:MAG: hypothetical protein JKY49_05525 [Cohaesibacteraceae bacterium]|nr:hypothetical protein [Cohaesibacteraceae bacterium]MBL4875058.1 hypothetical protein [Cohaesibacteraceae bacterium]
MSAFPIGMKIYDNNWYLKHNLEPENAAGLLAAMGINFVIAQSRLLPMQNNAISSVVPKHLRDRYAGLDDVAFRNALKDHNIQYYACMNIGFDADAANKHPEWLPVDQHGATGTQTDWYVGLSPTKSVFMDNKATQLFQAVSILKPDGVHFGFARWPGFWETWLPGATRNSIREYCYSEDTLNKFSQHAQLDINISNPVAAFKDISTQHRKLFTEWKCSQTHKMISMLKQIARSAIPNLPIAINTIPFGPDDFGNAVMEVLGQNHATLGSTVDIFEVMAYHQILKRPASWPAEISAEIRCRSRQVTWCTLQTGPHYTSSRYCADQRNRDVKLSEIQTILNSLTPDTIDGVCFFTMTDFLDAGRGQKLQELVTLYSRSING